MDWTGWTEGTEDEWRYSCSVLVCICLRLFLFAQCSLCLSLSVCSACLFIASPLDSTAAKLADSPINVLFMDGENLLPYIDFATGQEAQLISKEERITSENI